VVRWYVSVTSDFVSKLVERLAQHFQLQKVRSCMNHIMYTVFHVYDWTAAYHPLRINVLYRKNVCGKRFQSYSGCIVYLALVPASLNICLCAQRAILSERNESESEAGETVLLLMGSAYFRVVLQCEMFRLRNKVSREISLALGQCRKSVSRNACVSMRSVLLTTDTTSGLVHTNCGYRGNDVSD
jgi:hypothetical protein